MACNRGAYTFDDCSGSYSDRSPSTALADNIGNVTYGSYLIGCVLSRQGEPGTECFGSLPAVDFTGWQPQPWDGHSTPYRNHLVKFGM